MSYQGAAQPGDEADEARDAQLGTFVHHEDPTGMVASTIAIGFALIATVVGRAGLGPQLAPEVGTWTAREKSMDDDARQRLREAMGQPDPGTAVFELALALRSDGMGQVAMYRLYVEQFRQLSGDDPRYDALADTMDFIWGHRSDQALFPEALTDERLTRE